MNAATTHPVLPPSGPRWGYYQSLGRLLRLGLAFLCLAASCYYACLIAPAALGANAPTIRKGLYPEWIGCRDILLARQSPYRQEVTDELQIAVYGHLVGGSYNQQRFAYPAFFAFLFAPLALLPFPVAHTAAFLGCFFLTALSVLLWGRCWNLKRMTLVLAAVGAFASYPVLLGLQLCQPTLIIAALLAAVVYWVRSDRMVLAGLVAGLCTSKPHIAIGVLLPLSLWSLADWRHRRAFLTSLCASTMLLVAASALLVPGWFVPWLATVRAYSHYAGSNPLLLELVPKRLFLPAAGLILGAIIWVSLRWRESDLLFAVSFSLAAFQLLFPFLIYNEIVLLPAALWLLNNSIRIRTAGQCTQMFSALTWILLGTGLASSLGLSLADLLFPGSSMKLWQLPLVAIWLYPWSVFVAFLSLASRSNARLRFA